MKSGSLVRSAYVLDPEKKLLRRLSFIQEIYSKIDLEIKTVQKLDCNYFWQIWRSITEVL